MESHPENTASPTAPSATGVECQREAVPEADEQEPPTKRAAVEASSAAFIVGEPVSYAKESVEQKSNVVASVTQTQQQDLVPSVVRQIVAQQQVPFVPAVVSKPVWVKLTGEAGKMRGCRFALLLLSGVCLCLIMFALDF